jgi:hypothetical protein
MSTEGIERHFPELAEENWRITSEFDPRYNCVAFAAHDTHQFWDPGMADLGRSGWILLAS